MATKRIPKQKIIVVIAEKGGVGKSTIAIQTACTLLLSGETVKLVDTDPVQNCSLFAQMRNEAGISPALEVLSMREGDPTPAILRERESCDYLVVDVRAGDYANMRRFVEIGDLVLIPTEPSIFATHSAITFLQGITSLAEQLKRPIPAIAFLNKVNTQRGGAAKAERAIETLREHCPEITVIEEFLAIRTAYEEGPALGKSVHEMPTRVGGAAAQEFTSLLRASLGALQKKLKAKA